MIRFGEMSLSLFRLRVFVGIFKKKQSVKFTDSIELGPNDVLGGISLSSFWLRVFVGIFDIDNARCEYGRLHGHVRIGSE